MISNSLFHAGYSANDQLFFSHSDSGKDIDFSALPAFLRVLLTTDGTVTKSLESYFWEPIVVDTLAQTMVILESDLGSLDKKEGDKALAREVSLLGKQSGQLYVKAHSLIAMDILPEDIRKNIQGGQIGVGEILNEMGLESFREILSIGHTKVEEEDAIERTYRILVQGQPVMQITEVFPLVYYQ